VAYGRFEQAYVARVVTVPTLYAGHAYDGACMLIAAIRQAGLNRYRIRDALAATRRFEGVTGTIVLDRVYSHRGPVSLATVRLGAFVYGAPQPQVRF
jgi:branched-chain amino acid transport system substrate-binding protein